MLENQNAYGSAGLGRNIHWQVLGLGTSHVRLNCNTHWQASDPGLGAGLEREVWARPSWLQSPPVGMSQGWMRTMLDRGAAPIGMCELGLEAGQAELSCSIHGVHKRPNGMCAQPGKAATETGMYKNWALGQNW